MVIFIHVQQDFGQEHKILDHLLRVEYFPIIQDNVTCTAKSAVMLADLN